MTNEIEKLAKTVVTYSVNVQKGDTVMIASESSAQELINACIKEVLLAGGHPVLRITVPGSNFALHEYADDFQLEHNSPFKMFDAKNCDKFIRILSPTNVQELASINPSKIAKSIKAANKSKLVMLDKPWILTAFPTESQAKNAGMKFDEFSKYVYDSMNQDWNKQKKLQTKLAKLFDNAITVRLLSKDTNITFSLEGRKCAYSYGTHNLPDGEIFYSPLKKTVEGHITFSYPAVHRSGQIVDGIELWFKNGKVVKSSATKNHELLEKVLDTDSGSRYIGEFGIGTNYALTKYIKNILFDEKIGGTIHLALGMAYTENGGTNKSAVHWDILKDFRKEGQILVNETVVFENGKWIFQE